MNLHKAFKYLGDVTEHRQAIPYRRFNGGVGRTAQAKPFKTTQGQKYLCTPRNLSQLSNTTIGRWPEKSVRFMTRLLKNAESNADAKNLEAEELYIRNITVQQAPVRTFLSRRSTVIFLHYTHIYASIRSRKPAVARTVPMVA